MQLEKGAVGDPEEVWMLISFHLTLKREAYGSLGKNQGFFIAFWFR